MTEEQTVILSILNGDPISQLSNVKSIEADDLFIVARPKILDNSHQLLATENFISNIVIDKSKLNIKQIVSEHISEYLEQVVHMDYKTTYADLSTQLLNDISARLNFNTMAYHDSWEYSRKTHKHDYSKLGCYPNYTSSDILNQYEEKPSITDPHQLDEWLGTIEIYEVSSVYIGKDKKGKDIFLDSYVPVSTDIYFPHTKFKAYSGPDIGEMRFIPWKNIPTERTTNPKLEDFNGQQIFYDSQNNGYWAMPKGQTINCNSNQFVNACMKYGNNGKTGGDTSFTIPNLCNFMKMNPYVETSDPLKKVDMQIGVPQHLHSLDQNSLDISKVLKVEAEIPTHHAGGTTLGSTIHSGSNNENDDNIYMVNAISCKYDSSDVYSAKSETDSSGINIDGNIHPEYIGLPLLIYIGQK